MSDTSNRILDAAERIFSEHGYAGASMRLIATAADVSQALLHYHFRTKQLLYNEVFERRAKASTTFRAESLEQLFSDGKTPDLATLIAVLFASPPEWEGVTQPSFYFTPMVSALSIGEDERSKEMMTRIYDPFALKFIGAMKEIMPKLDHSEAVLCFMFALGVRVQVNARNGRIERLGGQCEKLDRDEINAKAIEFAVAGIQKLAEHD